MGLKRNIFFIAIGLFITFSARSQFWYGPKVGGRLITPVFQDDTYKDDYLVPEIYDFETGFVVNYIADKIFSAQVELNYERLSKTVKNQEGNSFLISKTTNHFIGVPLLLRASISTGPVHYYVNGGPKLSFWLGGNGNIQSEDVSEFFFTDRLNYRIVFNQLNGGRGDRRYVADPNLVQYGLTAGAGIIMDLRTGGRLMLDMRYTFGHSNMAFNRDADEFDWISYEENFEYRTNVLTASVSYLFNYDLQLRNKGMSTNPDSKRNIPKHNKIPTKKR